MLASANNISEKNPMSGAQLVLASVENSLRPAGIAPAVIVVGGVAPGPPPLGAPSVYTRPDRSRALPHGSTRQIGVGSKMTLPKGPPAAVHKSRGSYSHGATRWSSASAGHIAEGPSPPPVASWGGRADAGRLVAGPPPVAWWGCRADVGRRSAAPREAIPLPPSCTQGALQESPQLRTANEAKVGGRPSPTSP